MYKKIINSFLSVALLMSVSAVVARVERADDCCDKERTCAKNPLFCDGFNLSAYAGPSPIIWSSRGCIRFLNTPAATASSNIVSLCSDATNCNASPVCSTATVCGASTASCVVSESTCAASGCSFAAGESVAALEVPKFSHLFGTPWTVGAALGYALTENHEVLVEANYTQASNRREFFQATVGGVLLQPNLVSKYKNVTGYFGYRYNFDRGCRNVSWSLAAKAGVIHHYDIRGFVNSSLTSSIVTGDTTAFFPLFRSNTAFSGAAELGIDICLACDWSLLIGAEVSASWGPSCKPYARPVADLVTNNITAGKVGAEIIFPITFGLRYKF